MGKQQVKRLDNPLIDITTVKLLNKLVTKQELFMHRYRLSYQGFRQLLVIVTEFENTGKPLTPYVIHALCERDTSYQALYVKLEVLERNGLIEVVGYGKNKARLLLPTSKALKELSELVK